MKSADGTDLPTTPDGRTEEAQWQRASNEGWPDAPAALQHDAPPGAIAPRVAHPLPRNVVSLDLWRAARRESRHSAAR